MYAAYNFIYNKQHLPTIAPGLSILAQFGNVFMLAMAGEDFSSKMNLAIQKLEEEKVGAEKDYEQVSLSVSSCKNLFDLFYLRSSW